MAYEIEVHRRARRFLERLARSSPSDLARISDAIDSLAEDPRSPGSRKLRGRAPLWRVRVGDYRIVYGIFDPDSLITIEDILRRTSQSYKGLG